MARTLIGNFKGPEGPRGERGPQGEQGPRGAQGAQGEGIENNMMGSENLFSMSKEKWSYSGNILDYDYKNGVIKFSNAVYQFRYEIYLREGEYIVHADDVINPGRTGYENTVTLNLYDSNENNMRTIGILGGTESEYDSSRIFEITESEAIENDGVFHIQISVANSGRHEGEIKRLQIVRGELHPTWALSTEDSMENKVYDSAYFQGHFTGENDSGLANPGNIQFNVDESINIEHTDDEFYLDEGFYFYSANLRAAPFETGYALILDVVVGNTIISKWSSERTETPQCNLSGVLHIENDNTRVCFRGSTNNDIDSVTFPNRLNNKLFIKKI